jgi:hypothetical protein
MLDERWSKDSDDGGRAVVCELSGVGVGKGKRKLSTYRGKYLI